MIVSLRRKLIFWFLTFTALSLLLTIPFNFFYFNKREKITRVVHDLQILHVSLLKNRNLENEILKLDTKDPEFFRTGKSTNLSILQLEKSKLNRKIEMLEKNELSSNGNINEDFKELKKLIFLNDRYSDTILSCVIKMGFKNEGIIGNMRKNIHAIEKVANIDMVTVLMLRRHEKDYMLRSDAVYVSKLRDLVKKFNTDIQINKQFSSIQKKEIIDRLNNYLFYFNEMVHIDSIAGLRNNTGLIQKQDLCYRQIADIQHKIQVKAENEQIIIFRNLERLYFLYFCLVMLMALLLCLYISKTIAKPLRILTSYISTMKKENLKFGKIPEIKHNYTEAKILTFEFCQMFYQLEQREEEHHKYVEQLIEARKKAEISDKLKTSFLANMSHEIRTPMNAIIGFSSLLEIESKCEESKRDYIKHIKNSGKHLLKLIDDIIDIAKIEAGEIKISEKPCNLNMLIDELYVYFDLLKKKDVELVVSKDSGQLDFSIIVDASRLRQILVNLINNALKFTHNGTIEFGYLCTGKYIQFFVRDTGIGIPDDMQRTIFERFRQVDHNNKYYGGTGLGLTITQNLVNLMGGQIWVTSEVNRGSTFFFTLPFKKTETIYSPINNLVEV